MFSMASMLYLIAFNSVILVEAIIMTLFVLTDIM